MTAAPATSGRCVHCLRLTDVTDDHIIPTAWYPDNTPPTVQRWTAPSCWNCNHEHGKHERDFFIRAMLCIAPKSEAVSGLTAKALRSLGLDTEGLDENDKAHRDKLRTKFRSESIPKADVAGKPGQIPGLGPHNMGKWAVPIPWASFAIIAEKIARGCEYKLKLRFLEKPYGIRTSLPESGVVPEVLARFVQAYDFGPGFKITRLSTTDDPKFVIYWITLWGALYLKVNIDLESKLPPRTQLEGIAPEKAMRIPSYLREYNYSEGRNPMLNGGWMQYVKCPQCGDPRCGEDAVVWREPYLCALRQHVSIRSWESNVWNSHPR